MFFFYSYFSSMQRKHINQAEFSSFLTKIRIIKFIKINKLYKQIERLKVLSQGKTLIFMVYELRVFVDLLDLYYQINNILSYVTLYKQMSKIYPLLILQTLLLVLARTQILAIDYGTQFIKASLVHVGAGKTFSIVENPKSQRKFINSIGLYNQERFYEADTLSKRSRGPSNCFIYSHLLIDLHDNPSMIETVKKDLVLQYVKNPQIDQFLAQYILSGFPQGQDRVTLLETIAMTIRYVKRQAQKAAKGVIKDVVLVVPNHWNIHQRKFLVKAAELADLYVLSLIHQNTAAALNYALSQRSSNETQTVLFYNLGANSFQMTLAQFKQVKAEKSPKPIESIFILGDHGQPYVGGLKFDSLIASYFVKKFEEKHKRTLSQRGYIRLLTQSERMKYVLSANKQATVYVEGIMDGIDFSATITRRDFEILAQETFKAVTSPIKRFLFDHDLKPEDLHGVQLIGGGVRIPRIQTLLAQAIGNSSLIGTHINGDESMVLGAAFYGANSSKKFKVKGINLYDGFNFQMRIVLRNAQEDISEDDNRYYFKNVTLFKKKSRYGLTKEVSFKCKQNLIVEIYKEDEKGIQLITRHKIDSIKDINESNYKVSLTFQISPIEVVKLNQVKYLYSKDIVQSYTEKVRKYTKPNKTQEAEDQQAEQEEKAEEQEKEESDQKGQEEQNKTKPEKKKKKKQKIEYQTVQRFKNVTKNFQKDLQYKTQFYIFPKEESKAFERSQKLFARYESKEAGKRLLAESKHKLEALIYEMRQKIQGQQFLKYGQKKQIEKISTLVVEKGNWYEQTNSNNADDYVKEYKELNEPVQKIKKRIVEHRQRQDVKKRALEIVAEYSGLTAKIQKGKEWITDQEVTSLTQNITTAKENIQKLYQKLTSVPLNQDSAFRNKDLIKQADIVKDQYFVLKGKPKPKDFKSKKDKESKQEKEKEQQKQVEKQQKEEEQVKDDEL